MTRLFISAVVVLLILVGFFTIVWGFHWWTIPAALAAEVLVNAAIVAGYLIFEEQNGRNPFQ